MACHFYSDSDTPYSHEDPSAAWSLECLIAEQCIFKTSELENKSRHKRVLGNGITFSETEVKLDPVSGRQVQHLPFSSHRSLLQFHHLCPSSQIDRCLHPPQEKASSNYHLPFLHTHSWLMLSQFWCSPWWDIILFTCFQCPIPVVPMPLLS